MTMMLASKIYSPGKIAGRGRLLRLCSFSSRAVDGYRSIGSFHSDDPEELIRLPDHEYVAPDLPFSSHEHHVQEPLNELSAPSGLPFSSTLHYQKAYPDLIRAQWTFLNHGAFGLAVSCGIERANAWRVFLESQPLRYFDRYLLNHLVHSARCIVDFCSEATDDESKLKLRESVALIPNVTSGMNAVIRGHARCRNNGNKVFYYDIGYGSNKKMCQVYHGNDSVVIPFEDEFLPLLQQVQGRIPRGENDWNDKTAEVFIMALDAAVQKEISMGNSSKGSLLVLDHITSNTAIHTPVSAIAKYAKEEYGMVIAVDGAHGLLGLDLNMNNMLNSGDDSDSCFNGYVDIYITNAHKWFSSPRGAAVMFCANPVLRETILRQPAIISHGVDDGYLSRFIWDGCRDYAAQLSLPVIADYWTAANTNDVRQIMNDNLLDGVRVLISKWHHGISSMGEEHAVGLTLVPLDIHAPMMALVQLPLDVSGANKSSNQQMNSTDAKRFQDILYSQNIEVPVKCVRGLLYARVSCHLYNTTEDFQCLANSILKHK